MVCLQHFGIKIIVNIGQGRCSNVKCGTVEFSTKSKVLHLSFIKIARIVCRDYVREVHICLYRFTSLQSTSS